MDPRITPRAKYFAASVTLVAATALLIHLKLGSVKSETSEEQRHPKSATKSQATLSPRRIRDKGEQAGPSSEIRRMISGLNDPELSSNERRLLTTQVARYFGENDVDGGVIWINSMNPAHGNLAAASSIFGSAWAQKNFSYATWREISQSLTHSARHGYEFGALSGLGRISAIQSWENYLTAAKSEESFPDIKTSLLRKLSGESGEEMWSALQKSAESTDSETLNTFFSCAKFRDQSSLFSCLQSASSEEQKLNFINSYISNLSENDILAFTGSLTMSNLSPATKDSALLSTFNTFYYRSPSDAARLIPAIKDDAIRNDATERLRAYAATKGPDMAASIESELNSVSGVGP